jgi:hypothetical protein
MIRDTTSAAVSSEPAGHGLRRYLIHRHADVW